MPGDARWGNRRSAGEAPPDFQVKTYYRLPTGYRFDNREM